VMARSGIAIPFRRLVFVRTYGKIAQELFIFFISFSSLQML